VSSAAHRAPSPQVEEWAQVLHTAAALHRQWQDTQEAPLPQPGGTGDVTPNENSGSAGPGGIGQDEAPVKRWWSNSSSKEQRESELGVLSERTCNEELSKKCLALHQKLGVLRENVTCVTSI